MPKTKSWGEYKVECEAIAKPGLKILGWVVNGKAATPF